MKWCICIIILTCTGCCLTRYDWTKNSVLNNEVKLDTGRSRLVKLDTHIFVLPATDRFDIKLRVHVEFQEVWRQQWVGLIKRAQDLTLVVVSGSGTARVFRAEDAHTPHAGTHDGIDAIGMRDEHHVEVDLRWAVLEHFLDTRLPTDRRKPDYLTSGSGYVTLTLLFVRFLDTRLNFDSGTGLRLLWLVKVGVQLVGVAITRVVCGGSWLLWLSCWSTWTWRRLAGMSRERTMSGSWTRHCRPHMEVRLWRCSRCLSGSRNGSCRSGIRSRNLIGGGVCVGFGWGRRRRACSRWAWSGSVGVWKWKWMDGMKMIADMGLWSWC